MPKVKAYIGSNGNVVPVFQAIEGVAFLSPFDGKVFASKAKYIDHLKTVRAAIHREIQLKNKAKIMQALWSTAMSFQDIIDWVDNNQEFIYNQLLTSFRHKNLKKVSYDPANFKICISYLNLTYNSHCSNTHAAPHNGRTNWGGKETFKDGSPIPRGYPGWHGRIEFQIESNKVNFESQFFKQLRIHTGSGGSGNGIKYGYEVTFFDADWPALAEATALEYNMEKTMNFLADKRTPKLTYNYGTEDYFKW